MNHTISPPTPMMSPESLQSDDVQASSRKASRSWPTMIVGDWENARLPVDRAYREYCARLAAGEAIDPDDYCAQHPAMQRSLRRLVEFHFFLDHHSALVKELPMIRWPEAGESFLDYRLLLVLGQGAFARVFLAAEAGLGNRLVAVKISLEGRAEADVLGRIRHPNIVPVHSVQTDEVTGLTAVCMPYLGSATLCDVLDKAFPVSPKRRGVILEAVGDLPHPLDLVGQAPPDPLLKKGAYLDGIRLIGAQLAEALAFIHERGICHRDLKPSNVLLSPEGVPMLLDFNLCAEADRSLTPLGGTFPYMSPEQLRAMSPDAAPGGIALDAQSDLFSLGVILFELATGTLPFGPTPLKLSTDELNGLLLERQRRGALEAQRVNPNVDAALSALIQRCLAFDRQDRPQSAVEVALALRQQLAPAARRRRWVRRHLFKITAAAVVVLAAVLAGIAFTAMRPPWHDRQFETGLQHANHGRHRQALPYFNEVIQADPANAAALRARAHAYQELGGTDAKNYDLAIRDYVLADQLIPDGRNKAGQGYCWNRLSAEKSENAIACYKAAIKDGFAPAAIYNNLGHSYLRVDRPQDAKMALDRAIDLDPNLQAAYHNRALLAYYEIAPKASVLSNPDNNGEIYCALKAGIDDAQTAITLGSNSAEQYYNASCLCALATRADPAWKTIAVQYATEAIRQGYPSKKLTNPVLNPLRSDSEFKKLTHTPSAVQPLPPTTRLVDPIKSHTSK